MSWSHVPDISTKQLAVVLAVAEYRSFVAAAAALRMSQPALTRSLQRVEDILGVQLFERSTRLVRVTAAGREFVAVAQRLSYDLRISIESMREIADQKRGQVTVSAIMSLSNGVLPKAIASYRKEQPGVEVHIRDGIHGSVVDDVRTAAADFGLNYLEQIPDDFLTSQLGEGHFDIVAGIAHPITNPKRSEIALSELADVSFVSLPPEAHTRRILDATAAAKGVRLKHMVVASQIPAVLSLVRAGAGIAFVPSAAIAHENSQGLVRLRLIRPTIKTKIGVLRLKDRALSPAAEGLLREIEKAWQNN